MTTLAPPPPADRPFAATGQKSSTDALPQRAAAALTDAVRALLGKLRSDRAPAAAPDSLHWCAELEGDSILSSEYLLIKLILREERDDDAPGRTGRATLLRIR